MAAKNERFFLDGYVFASEKDYEQAKKEAESISAIRSEMDVSNPEKVKEVYRKLTVKGNFRTPVGIGFMRELQRYLAKKEETRKNLPPIPVPGMKSDEKKAGHVIRAGQEKTIRQELEQQYRVRYRNMKIVIGFLTFLVLVLFVVTWKDTRVDLEQERESIIDEYASWQEELQQWEEELNAREQALSQK